MPHPIAEAQKAAWELLFDAARRLGSTAIPDAASIRFRADGRGGELASPFPMSAGLDPAALADAANWGIWFEAAFPTGNWVGLNLSEHWRNEVRRQAAEPRTIRIRVETPPVPPFPAWIRREYWQIDVLLDTAIPLLAARLDTGNPARQIEFCLCRADQKWGKSRPDRKLICQCALLLAALEGGDAKKIAVELLCLSQMYLANPGEDTVVARLIRTGWDCLLPSG